MAKQERRGLVQQHPRQTAAAAMTTAGPSWTLSLLTLRLGYLSMWSVTQPSLCGDQLEMRHVIACTPPPKEKRKKPTYYISSNNAARIMSSAPPLSSEIHAASSVRSGATPKILPKPKLV